MKNLGDEINSVRTVREALALRKALPSLPASPNKDIAYAMAGVLAYLTADGSKAVNEPMAEKYLRTIKAKVKSAGNLPIMARIELEEMIEAYNKNVGDFIEMEEDTAYWQVDLPK